jgi:protein required for attachment to host cells
VAVTPESSTTVQQTGRFAMKKRETWVLVADSARAHVYRLKRDEKVLVPAWQHEPVGSRRPSKAIGSDRPGRTFDSVGGGRHAKEPPTDPARYEKERFAREVIERLEDDMKRHAFEKLIIVAAPQFLGDLRAAMSPQLAGCVELELNKDLSKLQPSEIFEHLRDVI